MVAIPHVLSFEDRVVIVTGAARGIGRACAVRFGAGAAELVLCDRRTGELDELSRELAVHGEPITRQVDVREPDEVDAFIAQVRDAHDRVDVLVNNAGGTFHSAFTDVSPKGEAMLIAENFTQVTHMVRSVSPLMPSGGAIVNVTSIEAHQGAPGFAVYAAMKAAVENLTRTLALELAPRSIRVNAVAPDAVPTTGDRAARAEMLADSGAYDPAVVAPLGPIGEPDDVAAVVSFLASDLARFVTGVSVPVDGGNSAAGGWRRVTSDAGPVTDGAA